MKYPCIVYDKEDIDSRYGDDIAYLSTPRYQVTVIDPKIDSPYTEKILSEIKYARFNRHYVADNLHHDVITIYF